MKKRILVAAVVVVLLVIGTGFGIIAAGTLGSADDPLVTLSYLNNKFKTELIAELDSKINERGDAITAKVDEKLGNIDAGGEVVPADAFLVVSLAKNQTLTCDAGAEFMLRDGSATVYGAEVSNTTSGTAAAVGVEVLANNMYISAASGGGISVTSDTAKLLIRGNYTISTPTA